MRWIRGPTQAPEIATKFRLPFEVAKNCTATFCTVANGDPTVLLDGTTMATPSEFSVVGLGPTKQFTARLEAGRHVVALALPDPRAEGLGVDDAQLGFSGAEFAFLLRLQFPDHLPTQYVTGVWKTSTSRDSDWAAALYDDDSWQPATVVTEARPVAIPKQAAILLRHRFTLEQPVKRARLYVSALGAYEVYLNGKRPGDAVLTPESTDFRRRVLYQVLDLTADMSVGENVVAALIGDGWYASRVWIMGRYPWSAAPRMLLLQLELTLQDGSIRVIRSNEQWRVARSAIESSDIYDGEHYDARQEQAGWNGRGFDDSHWEAAHRGAAPSTALTALVGRPVRRTEFLRAVSITTLASGAVVFDFGQNFAGWCRLQTVGNRGSAVELKFGELLKPTGEVDQSNLGPARATDTFILAGTGQPETFEPHFTYHGFRYVEVSGLSMGPPLDALLGVVVHSDLGITAELHVSDPTLQQLWNNTRWSQRSNFMGVPTDCPQRGERLGWLGDASVFWDSAATHMDVQEFTERFMRSIRDAQTCHGDFPDFVPGTSRFEAGNEGLLKVHPDWNIASSNASTPSGSSPGWADAAISLPWTVWRRYGDLQIIEDNWNAMSGYLASIEMRNPHHLWQQGRGADFGDWLSLDPGNREDAAMTKELVATCMWAGSLMRMEQMARATSRGDAARRYCRLRRAVQTAFVHAFLKGDGTVGNGCQTSQVLALYFRLVPARLRALAARRLSDNISERGGALSTGFLSTAYGLDVLADEGYASLAYSLLLRQEFPSWGYMIAQGATTIWENWTGFNGKVPCSRNHYALGAACGFVFRRIAGISPAEPGYETIALRPMPDPRIRTVRARLESVRGPIGLEWEYLDSQTIEYRIVVPANTVGILRVPLSAQSRVSKIGVPGTWRRTTLRGIGEIGTCRLEPGRHQLAVSAG